MYDMCIGNRCACQEYLSPLMALCNVEMCVKIFPNGYQPFRHALFYVTIFKINEPHAIIADLSSISYSRSKREEFFIVHVCSLL